MCCARIAPNHGYMARLYLSAGCCSCLFMVFVASWAVGHTLKHSGARALHRSGKIYIYISARILAERQPLCFILQLNPLKYKP